MRTDSLFYEFTVKSLLPGIVLGLACVIYVASPIKYIGSFLFSLGLLTIMVKEYYLYTGKVGDWTPQSTFRLLYMFVLNGTACAATAWLFTNTRIDLSAAQDLAAYKLNDNMLSSFILAVGCGAMMHIAYYGFHKGKNPLYVIMPVMFFILAGFEHSIADCGVFAMAEVDMTLTDWTRLGVIVLGNAVGTLVFTKFIPNPQAHPVPFLFKSDLYRDSHHIARAMVASQQTGLQQQTDAQATTQATALVTAHTAPVSQASEPASPTPHAPSFDINPASNAAVQPAVVTVAVETSADKRDL